MRGPNGAVKFAAALALLIAIGSLLGSWVSDDSFALGEPLRSGETYGTECVPDRGTGQATEAFHAIHNLTGHPLTIKAVRMLKPEGFVLKNAYLVPITNASLMGDVAQFPPPEFHTSPPGVVWSGRILIRDGTTIGTNPTTYNVALHLVQTAPRPSMSGVEIDYVTPSGARYRWQGHIGLLIRPKCG